MKKKAILRMLEGLLLCTWIWACALAEGGAPYGDPADRVGSAPVCAGNSAVIEAGELAAGEQLTLDAFPLNLKKGIGITFFSTFDHFESITVGKGHGSYRGDWFVIDQSDVTWVHNESGEEVREKREHSLSVSEYIAVTLTVDDDSVCHLLINPLTGSAALDFNWNYEQNGAPFVFGGQEMRDCRLSAVATDIDKPVWMFGDSYFGFSDYRIMGHLKKYGYTDGCLISGIAGATSADALDNNLRRLLDIGGRPEIVVWCLGMNGEAELYRKKLAELTALGEQYGFSIVLMRVPTVPKEEARIAAVNDLVLNSGFRYIDARTAVGANDAGQWYPGFLDSDNIHPTRLGAQAIAARFLVDFPEIMGFE